MLFAEVQRFDYGEEQTLGEFRMQDWDRKDIIQLKTLELAWRNNETGNSCIPEGEYDVRIRKARESQSFDYDHLLVQDVPHRSYILFHGGNYYHQIEGCLLLGYYHKDINDDGLKDVARSRPALRELLQKIRRREEDGFKLKVHSEDV